MDKCLHGIELPIDKCEECWNASMGDYFCRKCGAKAYYLEDFQHLTDCKVNGSIAVQMDKWRGAFLHRARNIKREVDKIND